MKRRFIRFLFSDVASYTGTSPRRRGADQREERPLSHSATKPQQKSENTKSARDNNRLERFLGDEPKRNQKSMSIVGKQFAIVGFALVSMFVASSCIAGTIGQKRCMVLDKQLSGLTHSAKGGTPKSVGELAEKARGLCAKGKSAQGLRAYAKALKLMGSQPVFPSEQQPKAQANLRNQS